MTGLFSGIIGSLIGAGIQAVYGGIPIREDAAQALEVLRRGGLPVPPENWFSEKSPPGQRREHGYGAIEQHVAGAIQILRPCMHIAKAITGAVCPESQSAAAKAWRPHEELARSKAVYKSAGKNVPMSLIPGTLENKECGCECSRSREETPSTRYVNRQIKKNCNLNKNNNPSESIERVDNIKPNKTAEKFGSSSSSNFCCNGQESKNVRPTASIKIEPNSRIKIEPNSFNKDKNLVITENGKIGKNDLRKRDMKVDKFTITAENLRDLKRNPSGRSSTVAPKSQKLVKPKNKTDKLAHDVDKCQSCQGQIRNITKAPLMPCGHIVCYKCLQTSSKTSFRCPKCGLKFN